MLMAVSYVVLYYVKGIMSERGQRSAIFVTVAVTLGIFFVVESIRRLVSVHLHCIISNLKKVPYLLGC